MAAVKAVRQAFETISLPSVIDLVPGGINQGVCASHACSQCSAPALQALDLHALVVQTPWVCNLIALTYIVRLQPNK